MKKIKPDYWGNIIYETAMGLYTNEKEAKEESWSEANFFPLYTQETVDELQKERDIYKTLYENLLDKI